MSMFSLFRSISVTLLGSIGATFVFSCGMMDLSVGAVYGLSSMVAGMLMVNAGMPPIVAMLCGLVVAALFGILNGFTMLLNARAVKDSGVHFKKLHATGCGARSAEWMQMKADMLNLPMTALKTADVGTVGSAMLTGIAIGVFRDLKDAAVHMVEEIHTYEPRAEMHEKYMRIYDRYEKVYNAVRPLV